MPTERWAFLRPLSGNVRLETVSAVKAVLDGGFHAAYTGTDDGNGASVIRLSGAALGQLRLKVSNNQSLGQIAKQRVGKPFSSLFVIFQSGCSF